MAIFTSPAGRAAGFQTAIANLRADKSRQEGDLLAREKAKRETARAASTSALDSLARARATDAGNAQRSGRFFADGAQFSGQPTTVRLSEAADKLGELNEANYIKAQRGNLDTEYKNLAEAQYQKTYGAQEARDAARSQAKVPSRFKKGSWTAKFIQQGAANAANRLAAARAQRAAAGL